MIGPFSEHSDKLESQFTQSGVDYEDAFEGMYGDIQFRTVQNLSHKGTLPLHHFVYPSENKYAYLTTYIHSEKKRKVQIRLKTTHPVTVWINREKTKRLSPFPNAVLDNAIVEVTLPEGWSRLGIRTQGDDFWPLGARVTTPEGKALTEGLKFDNQPRDLTEQKVAPDAKRQSLELDNIRGANP